MEAIMPQANKFATFAKAVFPESRVVLFGSYAKGCATKDSDIDVAVLCDDLSSLPTETYLEKRGDIYRLADEVDVRIEPHLISCANEHSGFVDEILGTGIVLHG